MKVLTSAKAIRDAMTEVQPAKVAVAYVGSDWKQYVSLPHLREIVLSPTLGSNPKAIDEIMQTLKPEHVHFLDNLHAKFYLGKSSALLGSCNLTANGMADQRLLETAVVLTDESARLQLEAEFTRYKKLAQTLYPTEASKLARLKKLNEQADKAKWYGLGNSGGEDIPSIADYQSTLDRIHICWYESTNAEYHQKNIRKGIPKAQNLAPDDYFASSFAFHSKDQVRAGDWILGWRCNSGGLPTARGDISWMYVHEVIPGGFKNSDYLKLAGEAKPKFMHRPPQPFLLDEQTKSLFRQTIVLDKFSKLLSRDDSVWRLAPADKVTPEFIETLKRASRARDRQPH
jgi:hypothetical protein